jgi:hypothetical protein
MFVYVIGIEKLRILQIFFLLSSYNVMQPAFNKSMLPKSTAFLQVVHIMANMLKVALL